MGEVDRVLPGNQKLEGYGDKSYKNLEEQSHGEGLAHVAQERFDGTEVEIVGNKSPASLEEQSIGRSVFEMVSRACSTPKGRQSGKNVGEPGDGSGVERVGYDGGGAEAAAGDRGQGGGEVDAPPSGAGDGEVVS
jgi:hypothetical protein